MNKKINYLAILPAYGTCIMLIWLFIRMVKGEINKKKFYSFMFGCGCFSVIMILILALLARFVYSVFDFGSFLSNYEPFGYYVIVGYLVNLFVFTQINRKWDDLENI